MQGDASTSKHKYAAPVFAPKTSATSDVESHIDLDDIFEDCFSTDWALLSESLGVEGGGASGDPQQDENQRGDHHLQEPQTNGGNGVKGKGALDALRSSKPITLPVPPKREGSRTNGGKGSLDALQAHAGGVTTRHGGQRSSSSRHDKFRGEDLDDDDDEYDDDEDFENAGASRRRGARGTGTRGGPHDGGGLGGGALSSLMGNPNKKKRRRVGTDLKSLTDQQRVERRERNREHAKRSRIRKKFLLESLLEQVSDLRTENKELRQVIRDNVPDEAHEILHSCSTEESLLLCAEPSTSPINATQQLMEPDFRLMMALQAAQQNFAVSDPSLPDNPIVYASKGFLQLTGYTMQQVVGRNCRFLQGPGTDPKAVNVIRQGVQNGVDTSVCLLNYKADGTPFWNQFFVAALRDADGAIVNYVGVQCQVNQVPIEEIKERAKRMALLDI